MGGQVSSGTTERWGPGRSPGVCSLRGTQRPFFTNAVLILELGAFPSPQSLGQGRAPRPDPAQSNSHTPSQLPTHSSPAPLCPLSAPPPTHLPWSSRVCSQRHRPAPSPSSSSSLQRTVWQPHSPNPWFPPSSPPSGTPLPQPRSLRAGQGLFLVWALS